MEQRISLVTLGVADVSASKAFYGRLGWKPVLELEAVFFQVGGMIVSLWDRAKLAEDSTVKDGGGWGGVTLAYNAASPEAVHAVIEEARRAGAKIGREPAATFWGGYSGVFVDPDGHPWEVAHNPGFELRPDGTIVIPPQVAPG